jgi:aryl-phospho-beta-D-glucosidase BglC (GH1 family)
MINSVAAAGFNTIRIPVAWNSHASQTAPYTINPFWMNRVKEVVDWSLDAGLTVVINSHWDGGWFESNIGTTVNPTINAKMNSYWTQIANNFAGYDERLLFAAANEPNIRDDELDNVAQMSTLTSYYQTFVNAVRGTGGSNTSRWLVVQGPNTDIDMTDSLMNTLPSDPTENRLAVEVHYYDPFQFSLMLNDEWWGNQFYFWGDDHNSATLPTRNATHSEEDHLVVQLQKMNTKFVSQGIPVILGEFSATNRTGNSELTGDDLDLHLASRLYYHELIVDTANSMGIAALYWDNGWTGLNGSGIFNRDSATVFDQDTVDALTGGPGLPGDFNGDGAVDAADYAAWRKTTEPADGYDTWLANFGLPGAMGAGSRSPAVPEPCSLILGTTVAMSLLNVRQRRRQTRSVDGIAPEISLLPLPSSVELDAHRVTLDSWRPRITTEPSPCLDYRNLFGRAILDAPGGCMPRLGSKSAARCRLLWEQPQSCSARRNKLLPLMRDSHLCSMSRRPSMRSIATKLLSRPQLTVRVTSITITSRIG